jgi:hypothetical protein
LAIDVKEIHGYEARFGLRIFREEALERLAKANSHSSHPVAEGLAKEQGNS